MWCWLVKFKRFNTDTVANTDTFAVAVAVAIAIAVAVAVAIAIAKAIAFTITITVCTSLDWNELTILERYLCKTLVQIRKLFFFQTDSNYDLHPIRFEMARALIFEFQNKTCMDNSFVKVPKIIFSTTACASVSPSKNINIASFLLKHVLIESLRNEI